MNCSGSIQHSLMLHAKLGSRFFNSSSRTDSWSSLSSNVFTSKDEFSSFFAEHLLQINSSSFFLVARLQSAYSLT